MAFEKLVVGQQARLRKTIERADVVGFAAITGDTNPVHLDEDYARGTQFCGCIAHGMLTGSLFSTLLGTQLPGHGAIYLSQSFKFLAPVWIGDQVEAEVTIAELIPARRRVRLDCMAWVKGRPVVSGEAMIMVPA
ncbi:MAG: MaoC family dehydratase [Pseudomonadota bacterium]